MVVSSINDNDNNDDGDDNDNINNKIIGAAEAAAAAAAAVLVAAAAGGVQGDDGAVLVQQHPPPPLSGAAARTAVAFATHVRPAPCAEHAPRVDAFPHSRTVRACPSSPPFRRNRHALWSKYFTVFVINFF